MNLEESDGQAAVVSLLQTLFGDEEDRRQVARLKSIRVEQ